MEDSTNPDTTAFVINAAGNVGIGVNADANAKLSANGGVLSFGIYGQGLNYGVFGRGNLYGVNGYVNGSGSGVYGIAEDGATMIGVEGSTNYSEGTGTLSIG